MTTPETRPAKADGAARPWPKALLAASLSVNILVAGIVLGAVLHEWREPRFPPPPPDRDISRSTGFTPFIDAMPRDARRQMEAALREHGGMEPDREALAQELHDLLAALRGQPFDPAALDIVLLTQHQRLSSRVEAGREVLVDQVTAMTPAERAAFADALETRFQRALDRERFRPDDDHSH
ncbi:MAG: periplasmic heavy metal sensor [Maritimibacter sp.]|nr:periplasmic heavy metal sensor [Maritimibacter sp.]